MIESELLKAHSLAMGVGLMSDESFGSSSDICRVLERGAPSDRGSFKTAKVKKRRAREKAARKSRKGK